MSRRKANSRRAKSRTVKPLLRYVIVVCVIVFAVLLLLLRLWNFTHGHVR
jgi:hypothetical protein